MKRIASAWVVDDDDGDVFLATHYLSASKRYASICVASDGLEALERMRDPNLADEACPGPFPPRVIFLDINMPRLNGFEFLRELEKMAHVLESIVVVMLTSSSLSKDYTEASKSPLVKEYLVKPIDEEAAIRIAEKYGVDL